MKTRLAVLLGAGILLAGNAMAQSQGDWLIRAGVGFINTDVSSGDLVFEGIGLDDFRVDVDNNTRPIFNLTWMASDHVGLELLAAVPFRHNIDGAGALEPLGRLGRTKHLPPTFSVQYHFMPDHTFRPYAGIGLNYTYFFSERTTDSLHEGIIGTANAATGSNYSGGSTDLNIKNSTGLALQLGVDFALEGDWFVNLDLRWIDIEADARLTTNTFDGAGQDVSLNSRIKADIDPWVISTAVGFKF